MNKIASLNPGPEENREWIWIIYGYRKPILLFLVLVTVIAVIISSPMITTPKYRAEVIIFPPSVNTNKLLIENEPRFGRNTEVDEHMQILKSNALRDSVIKKNGLVDHYGFKARTRQNLYQLEQIYSSNVRFSRTRHNAISIEVFDVDPDVALHIAADIVTMGDKQRASIIKQNFLNYQKSLQKEYNRKEIYVEALEDTLQQFLDMNPEGQLDLELENRKSRYKSELVTLNLMKMRLDELASYIQEESPRSNIINTPEVSFKKAYPNRKVMVAVALLGGLLFCLAAVIVVEKGRAFRQKARLHQNA